MNESLTALVVLALIGVIIGFFGVIFLSCIHDQLRRIADKLEGK